MVPVRIFRVEHLLRFTRAFHLLTIIGEERGNVEFYSSGFDLVVVSRHLFVVLHIKPPFLLYYQPPIFSRFLRIHLWEFRDHLRDTLLTSSSMDFNLDCRRYPPLAALTFHDDTVARSTRILWVSNTEYIGNLGDVTLKKFVSINSEQLKRIAIEFMNIDKVNVVLTNSQVTFSSEFKGPITFNVENNECLISGVNDDERTEYSVKFRPTSFFCELATLVDRVWFYHETVKSEIILSAPVSIDVILMMSFRN